MVKPSYCNSFDAISCFGCSYSHDGLDCNGNPILSDEFHHLDPVVDFTGVESLAHEEFLDESDINNIIKKFRTTGCLIDPSVQRSRVPQFGDYTNAPDFQRLQEILSTARMRFEALPSQVRDAFGGDPSQLLAFLDQPPADRDAHLSDLLVRFNIIAKAAEAATPEPCRTAKATEEP